MDIVGIGKLQIASYKFEEFDMIDYYVTGDIEDGFFVGTFSDQGFYDKFYQCGLSDLPGTAYREDVSGIKFYLIRYWETPAIFLGKITVYVPILVDVYLPLPSYVPDGIVSDLHYLVLWLGSTYKYLVLQYLDAGGCGDSGRFRGWNRISPSPVWIGRARFHTR